MTQQDSSVKLQRSALRKSLLKMRIETDLAIRQEWDAVIIRQILAWCQENRPESLGVFWPIQSEPNLLAIYPLLKDLNITLGLPFVAAKGQPLQFLTWSPGDAMCLDDFGIAIPEQRTQFIDPSALLIPCVGFNTQQYRLGYGGGYYDRTLAIQPRPIAIGIAYAQALCEFPASQYDIPMNFIISNDFSLIKTPIETPIE